MKSYWHIYVWEAQHLEVMQGTEGLQVDPGFSKSAASNSKEVMLLWILWQCNDFVDGWNPAPPRMMIIL